MIDMILFYHGAIFVRKEKGAIEAHEQSIALQVPRLNNPLLNKIHLVHDDTGCIQVRIPDIFIVPTDLKNFTPWCANNVLAVLSWWWHRGSEDDIHHWKKPVKINGMDLAVSSYPIKQAVFTIVEEIMIGAAGSICVKQIPPRITNPGKGENSLEGLHDHDDAVSAGWVRGPGDLLVEGEAALFRFKVFQDMAAAHGSKQIHTMDPIPSEDSSFERARDVPQSADWSGRA
jgi:hypothetical protein